jgi:hypothetical protein
LETVDVKDTLGDGTEQVIVAVLFDKLKVGMLASAVIDTVPDAERQPLTVLVATTVNIPLPPTLGLLTVVLLMVPVPGAVQLYVAEGSALLLAVMITEGAEQVVVYALVDKLIVGTIVFVGTFTV